MVKVRDPYFDNAKFLLISLVIIGHIIEPLIHNNHIVKTTYLFIYSFHMPAFVLISGYFFKHSHHLPRRIIKLLILYLLFSLLYLPYTNVQPFLLRPFWILWFIVSLIFWNVMLPYVTKTKHPILLTILFALLAGYMDSIGYFLSLSRTVVFFPFFVIQNPVRVLFHTN